MRIIVCFLFFFFLGFKSLAQANFERFNFDKADSIAVLYPKYSLFELDKLVQKLTSPLANDFEKFRAIYTWVCKNIENDYNLFFENQRKRRKFLDKPESLNEWNRKFSKKVFKTLLQEYKSNCTGYALLIKEMAYHANIKCEVVHGYGRTIYANTKEPGKINHSWNAVKLGGKWYLCDATWSSGSIIINRGTKEFKQNYDTGYFLASPCLFICNHYPIDPKWLLCDSPISLQEFLNAPIIYRNMFKYQLKPILPEKLNIKIEKGEKVRFCFEEIYDEAIGIKEIKLDINQVYTIKIPLYKEINNNYCANYIFDRRGNHITHILFNDEHIATYEIKVAK